MKRLLLVVTPLLVLATLVLAAPPDAGPEEPHHTDPAVQDLIFFGDARPILVRLRIENAGKPFRQVWQAFVADLFKKLDADGDGVLSRAESAKLPPPSLVFTGVPNEFVRPPAKMRLDDFADFCRQQGGAPFQFSSGNNVGDVTSIIFDSADALPPPAGPEAVNKALFERLDADKDGRLSREELAAGGGVLGRLDLDDDEMIAVDEVLGRPPAPVGDEANVVIFDSFGTPARGANGPFEAVIGPGTGRALAGRLLQAFGANVEPQPARRLAAKDLSLSPAAMKLLDADGDGWLDAEELGRFHRRPPDVTVVVRMNQRDTGDGAVEVVPPKGGLPSDVRVVKAKDAGPVLELGSVRVSLSALAAPPETSGDDLAAQYSQQMKEADTDGNGYLDVKEARQNGLFRPLFEQMDADRDGMLFEKEVKAYASQLSQYHAGYLACVSATAAQQGRGLFDLLDTNADGRLSVRELRQVPRLREELDRDGDAAVSLQEVPKTYRLTFQHGPTGSVGDGQFLAAAGGAAQPPLPELTEGPLWFRKMDRNRDGDVSRREFLGTGEQFRKLDGDGDGLVSRAEAEAGAGHQRQ